MTEDVPLLDHGVVAELRQSTGDDEAFVLELIGDYIAEATGQLDGMAAAIATGDVAGIVRAAHTLKSTSASVGAMRLAGICRSLEEAGRDNRVDGLVDQIHEARAAWVATLDAFRVAGLTP